jgi:hypothetical protein
MAKHDISASKLIPAPARKVYDLIADYRNGHPRILPKPYFVSLHVEEGGYGTGTVIKFQMQLMGRIQSFHSEITEPVPGHILVETDMNNGTVTTFTVDPSSGGQESFVTIRVGLRSNCYAPSTKKSWINWLQLPKHRGSKSHLENQPVLKRRPIHGCQFQETNRT